VADILRICTCYSFKFDYASLAMRPIFWNRVCVRMFRKFTWFWRNKVAKFPIFLFIRPEL